MANRLYTTFQNMSKVFNGAWSASNGIADLTPEESPDKVLYTTEDPQKYQEKKLELQQNKYLANRWVRANQNLSMSAFANLSNIKLMYRDADLMDSYPEIGAALDLCSEESVQPNPNNGGQIVNVSSKSDRIKSILEDLFVNRLNLQVTAQMVIRAMCKYGNQFMLLDIDKDLGVKGWRQLPVGEVERIENGITNPYGGAYTVNATNTINSKNEPDKKDTSTKFMWTSETGGELVPFRNWQIAHFRLLHNSMFLPYGVSMLSAARRHFRMLALMEDMMLIYRLERSMERRVYKIYVGALDDEDIPAYVEEIANQFKRTPIVDPMTGQLDLRKNILPVWKDTPIPLLDGRTITIEQLAKEYDEGKTNYVYSIQDETHKIVPGKVVWCGKNYTAEKLYKITLDDETYMVMAGEHEIIMRDGSKKRADEILEGESIMPLYRSVDKDSKKLFDRYEKVYNPASGKYEFTHRLIGESIEKNIQSYNTIHHRDFNKYNNSPENLLWCDYHEHHKMHSELAKKNWADPEKRKLHIQRLSEACKGRIVRDDVKEKISQTLKSRYANGELDHVKEISRETLNKFNNSPARLEMNARTSLRNHLRGCPEGLRRYNASKLHEEHNEIRRIANIEKWADPEKRAKSQMNMTVKFDDFVWNSILDKILSHEIRNRKGMLDYINKELIEHIIEINNNKRLSKNGFISRSVLQARVKEIGFATISEYIEESLKNHKVKCVEVICGDDVYCMTVEGLSGEQDRHNFALSTLYANGEVCQNGCFVSNCSQDDFFIPVRDMNATNPIETLAGAKNLEAIDDIKYIQKKVCAALRIPQSFLNFEEATGDGKNLALMDVRFARTINRFQQAFLMELTKIATIHLYLLGFEEDLTNFNLSMNNPSTQAEQLELENLQKKIAIMRDAVSDPGNGIPILSAQEAWKRILKFSDKEIKDMLEEIRLEKALSAEYEKTSQIIKRSGIFDTVDRMYGEPGAEYVDDNGGEMGGQDGGMPGGGGGGMPGGFDDFGGPGGDTGEISGEEGIEPVGDMVPEGGPEPNAAPQGPPMENVNKNGKLLTEQSLTKHEVRANKLFNQIVENMNTKKKEDTQIPRVDVYDKNLMINEEMNGVISKLDDLLNDTLDEIIDDKEGE